MFQGMAAVKRLNLRNEGVELEPCVRAILGVAIIRDVRKSYIGVSLYRLETGFARFWPAQLHWLRLIGPQ